MKSKSEDGWRKPILDVSGQTIFWDCQADSYEKADMTIDNQQEIYETINACRFKEIRDLITLGGAVGCRDPKIILDYLRDTANRKVKMPGVIFNDLSQKQVDRAREDILKPFTDMGVDIQYMAGEINTVCKSISHRPRRFILGVYNCSSFFNADAEAGYPNCGFDEYLRNTSILGNEFLLEWVHLSPEFEFINSNIRSKISLDDDLSIRLLIKKSLKSLNNKIVSNAIENIIGLQIIGTDSRRQGFFLSHWYNHYVLSRLLYHIFHPRHFSITYSMFAKGMIYIIDPIDKKPQGIITMLNNVLGNILPSKQIVTLTAIRDIMR